ERWGDDTKTVVRQEGELKIEDFVEFEETEPTVVEEILYELVYSGDNLKTCRQLHRSRSESRNFRKIKKRRTKRKVHPNDDSSYITSQATSRDTSGTRSPYYNDSQYSPDRSSTPTQSVLSTSWQSTGFTSTDRSNELPLRSQSHEGNYVNKVPVNEYQTYPRTTITQNNIQYETFETDNNDKQKIHLVDEMRYISNQIDTLITADDDDGLIENDKYTPIINEKRGITQITLAPTTADRTDDRVQLDLHSIDTNELLPSKGNDQFRTTFPPTDDKEQSRINIIEQTSLPKEISRQQIYSTGNEKQINDTISTKYDESEKEDEDQSSTTGPTVQENEKDGQRTGKDTDEDASFSEGEQFSLNSAKSDTHQQARHAITDQFHASPLTSSAIIKDENKTIDETKQYLIDELNDIESQLKSLESEEEQLRNILDRKDTEELFPSDDQSESVETFSSNVPEKTVLSVTIDDDDSNESIQESEEDLRPFLNSLTAHLMPELPRIFEDETEDELSFTSESKSFEEPTSQEDHATTSEVQQTKEKSHQHISSEQIETKTQDDLSKDQTISNRDEAKQEQKEHDVVSDIKEDLLDQHVPTTKETPYSIDSSVDIAQQILTTDKISQDQNEQETISLASSTPLQSRQITSEETHEVTDEQSSNVDSLTDIVRQANTQPSNEEKDKLPSVDAGADRTQPVSTSEETQQELGSSISSIANETGERRTSIDRQERSLKLQSSKVSDEQLPSDSLIDIVRQIRTIPQITRLPFTDTKLATTDLTEYEIEKPSVDYHIDIIETNESIPHEPVTITEERLLSTADKQASVTETLSESTSQDTVQETQTERLSFESEPTKGEEHSTPPLATQINLSDSITETPVFTEKQPLNESFDKSVDENIDKQQVLPGQQSTHSSDLSITEKHVTDEFVTDAIPISTQFVEQTTHDIRRSSVQKQNKEDVAEQLSANAITGAIEDIHTTPSPVPRSEDKIRPDLSTSTTVLEEKPLEKPSEVEVIADNESQSKTQITSDLQTPAIEDIDTEKVQIIESTTSPSITDVQPKHEETVADQLSSEALADVVRQIHATSLATQRTVTQTSETTHEDYVPSADLTVPTNEKELTLTTSEIAQNDIESAEKPLYHDKGSENEADRLSSNALVDVECEILATSPASEQRVIEDQRLSTEALTTVVHELLSMPTISQRSSIEHKVEKIFSQDESTKSNIPSKDTLELQSTPEQQTISNKDTSPTGQHELEQNLTDVSKDVDISATSPSYQTPTQETRRKQVTEEVITDTTAHVIETSKDISEQESAPEIIAENLSTKALTEVVREMLTKPSDVRVPEAKGQSQINTEQAPSSEDQQQQQQSEKVSDEVERLTSAALIGAVEEIRSTIQDETHESDTTTEAGRVLADEQTEQKGADHLPTQALTDVVQGILATPASANVPSEVEKVRSSDQLTEAAAENVTTDVLTEVVREMLVSPLSVRTSSIAKETTIDEEKPSEEVMNKSPTATTSAVPIEPEVTVFEEIKQLPETAEEIRSSKDEQTQKPDTITTITETTTTTTTEDSRPLSDEKIDHRPIQILAATVKETHVTPASIDVPSQETIVEKKAQFSEDVEMSSSQTVTSIAEEEKSPSDDHLTETAAGNVATDALTEVVHEMLASLPSPRSASDVPVSEVATVIEEVKQPFTEPSQTTIELVTSSEISSEAPINIIEENRSFPDVTINQIEPDRSAGEALTASVEKELTTPTVVDLPSQETTADRKIEAGEVVETPSSSDQSMEIAAENVSTKVLTEVVHEILESSPSSSLTSAARETFTEDQKPVEESASSEGLTEIVREVLTKPSDIRTPKETIVNEEAERLTSEALTDAVEEVRSSTEVPTQKSDTITVITETATPSEETRLSTNERINEQETDRSTGQIQTDAIQEAVAIPKTTDFPSEDTVVQTESVVAAEEKPPSAQAIIDTAEDHQLLSNDQTKELEPEILPSEALTEVVHQMLATPLSIPLLSTAVEHQTSVEEILEKATNEIVTSPAIVRTPETSTLASIASPEELTTAKEIKHDETISDVEKTEEVEAERLLSTALSEAIEEIRLATEESKIKPETITITTETTATTTTEESGPLAGEQVVQNEKDHSSTQALTNVVEEILATSSSAEVVTSATAGEKSVDEILEKRTEETASTEALTSIVRDALTKPVSASLQPSFVPAEQETTIIEEVKLSAIEPSHSTVERTTSSEEQQERQPETAVITGKTFDEYKAQEVEAERLSSEALTDVVKEIRSIAEQKPRAPVAIGKTTTTTSAKSVPLPSETISQKADRLTTDAISDAVQEVADLSSADSTTEKATVVIEEMEIRSPQTITSSTEDQQPLSDNLVKEVEHEAPSTTVLTEVLREILASPPSTSKPSITLEPTVQDEKPAEEVPKKHTETTTSTDTLTDLVHDALQNTSDSLLSASTTTTEQQIIVTEERRQSSTEPSQTTIELVTSSEIPSQPPIDVVEQNRSFSDDTINQIEPDRSAGEALTESVEKELTTPTVVDLPSQETTADRKIEADREILESSPSSSLTSAAREALTEDQKPVEESASSEGLTEIVREVLTKPSDIRTPKETIVNEEAERLTSEALTDAVEEIRSSTEVPTQKSDRTTEESHVLADDQRTQALTSVVQEILATPPSVALSSEDSTTDKRNEVTEASFAEAAAGTTEDEKVPSNDQMVRSAAENVVTEALAEVIREMRASSPSTLATSVLKETTSENQEPIEEIREKTTTISAPISATSTKDETSVTEEEKLPLHTTVEEIRSNEEVQEHSEKVSDELKTREAERLSSKALTSAVEEIRSTTEEATTSITEESRLFADDIMKEKEADRLIAEAITGAAQEILAASPSNDFPSTDARTGAETSSPGTAATTKDDEQAPSRDQFNEIQAENLSWEALTGVVSEILATSPVAVAQKIDSTSQKTTAIDDNKVEKEPPVETSTSTSEQKLDTQTDKVESLEKHSSTEETLQKDKPTEIEAVHEYQATTQNDSLPLIPEATVDTSETEHSKELPTTETPIQIRQQSKAMTPPTVIITSDDDVEISDAIDEISQPTELSSITEISEETTPDDVTKQEELTEQLSSPAPTEVKGEIPATPPSVHPPADDGQQVVEQLPSTVLDESHKEETLPTDALTETVRQILSTPISTIESPTIASGEVTKVVVSSVPTTDTVVPTEVTFIPELKLEKTPEQAETDNITTDSLVETVRLVLATPLTIHLPSTDVKSESTLELVATPVKDQEEKPSVDSLVEVTRQAINVPQLTELSEVSKQPDISSASENESSPSSADAARHLPEQSEPAVVPKVISDETSDKTDVTDSYAEYYPTSSLTNIVNAILNLPNQTSSESSVPHEENQIIASSKPDFDEQFNTTELTNINAMTTKIINSPAHTPEQSDTTEDVSSQRASAVQSTLIDEIQDNATDSEKLSTFFVPQESTISEKDFRELYEQRHFITTVDEDLSAQFTSIDQPEPAQVAIFTDEKKPIPTSTLAYYEIQEQRHTLMSPQNSVVNETNETTAPMLTTWTTVQPRIEYEETKTNDKKPNINLDDQAYELARRFDLESPAIISHLPIREYRQVFGIPDDIVNTIDDMTHHVDQVLSMESKNQEQKQERQPIVTDQIKSLPSESSEDSELSIVDTQVSENIKIITEAIHALESEIIEQENTARKHEQQQQEPSSVSSTVEGLINELEDLEPSIQSAALINDNRETLEHESTVFPSKDELGDEDLLPRTAKQEPANDKSLTVESTSQYSDLLDQIGDLEKSLLDLQPSSSTVAEREETTIETDDKKDDEHQLHQRYDLLIDHVKRLEDALIKDRAHTSTHTDEQTDDATSIDNLSQTMEQILATPIRTVTGPHEEPVASSDLEDVLEQILATTHYPTSYPKLSQPTDTTVPVAKQNDVPKSEPLDEDIVPIDTRKDEVAVSEIEETVASTTTQPATVDEKETALVVTPAEENRSIETVDEKQAVTSLVPNFFTSSDVYHAYKQSINVIVPQQDESTLLEKATTIVNNIISNVASILPTEAEQPSISAESQATSMVTDDENGAEGELSSEGLIEIMKNLLPNSLRPFESDQITSEEPSAPYEDDQDSLPPSVIGTTVQSISEGDNLTRINQSTVEASLKEELSIPVPEYFTSNDVYHGYKQPLVRSIEEKHTASLTERVTSMVAEILSSAVHVLPTLESLEEPIISNSNEPTVLLATMEEASNQILSLEQDATVTHAAEQKAPIASYAPGYFTSSDVYHAYKQPTEAIVAEKEAPSNSVSEVLPTAAPHESASTITEEHFTTSGLMEIIKDLLPTKFQANKTELNHSEDLNSLTEDDGDSMSSSMTGTTVRTLSDEDLTRMTQSSMDTSSKDETLTPVLDSLGDSDIRRPAEQQFESRVETPDSLELSDRKTPIDVSVTSSTLDEISTSMDTSLTEQQSEQSRVTTTESTIMEDRELPSTSDDSEAVLLKPTEENMNEPASTTGLLEIMTSFLPVAKSETSEEHLVESNVPSVNQISADIGETESGILSKLTSAVTDAITTVQHILPASLVQNTDAQEEADKLESTAQTSETAPNEQHSVVDYVIETASNIKEALAHIIPEETPIESLQSSADLDQKVIPTENEQSTAQYRNDTPVQVEEDSDQLQSSSDITSVSEEIKPHYPYKARQPQALQVLSDEYPWYASYYTIADADANMGHLYKRLSRTLEQLEQRPPPTTVQFEPEPYQILPTPEYDRQALLDTEDTREKVHELAQMSKKISPSSTIHESDEDDEVQVKQRRKQKSASATQEKTSSPSTTPKNKLNLSPENEQADESIPAVQTMSTTSSKKKNKKSKKDKKDAAASESLVLSKPDVDESKPEPTLSSTKVEPAESVEPKQATSSVAADSVQIEQQQKISDGRSEEQQAEPLSLSVHLDAEELKILDDDKNDSTSSDASQWSTSSFVMVSDDQIIDSQSCEKLTDSQTAATVSSPIYESIRSEITTSSLPTPKKKKVKQQQQQPSEKDISQQTKVSTSPVILEAPKVTESKPSTSAPSKIMPIVRTKIVTLPKEEGEIDDDDEGFQVVSYRKRVSSVTGPEKGSGSSSSAPATPPAKKRFSAGADARPSTTSSRQSASIPVLTSILPKQKKDKKDLTPSSSVDTDSVFSPSIDTQRSKQVEQQKESSDTTSPKSLFSSLLTSTSGPSVSTEDKSEQRPKVQDTNLQTQITPLSVSAIETSKAQTKPTSPAHAKSAAKTTLRTKASTSPEEDYDDDDEGFQVVRHRKRLLSTPRSAKTLPPVPTGQSSYRQNLGRTIDLKPVVIRGRYGSGSGSGSRSAPRSNTNGQTTSDKRQQNKSKRDRPQLLPLSSPRPVVSKETQSQSVSAMEPKRTAQSTVSLSNEEHQQANEMPLQSLITEQVWKPIEQSQWTATYTQQQPKPIDSNSVLLSTKPTTSDENQSEQTAISTSPLLSTIVSTQVEKSSEQKPNEQKISSKPAAVQQSSVKETTETSKAVLADDEEDEDGFRVVRYRKHPASATTTPTFPRSFTLTSDPEKRAPKISKKQHSLPSTPASTPTVIRSMIFKRTPLKPKKSGDQSGKSTIRQSGDILSSSTTNTADLLPLMPESYPRPKPIEPVSSLRSTPVAPTGIATTKETSTKDKKEPMRKLLDDSDEKVQSTTSPIVTSADTSDEQSNKTKKKHKRTKKETAEADLSTPSEEVSQQIETISSVTTAPVIHQSQTTLTTRPLMEIEPTIEQSNQIITQTDTRPLTSMDSSTNVDDEQDKTTTAKKSTKRRKKKGHVADKQEQEESTVHSSTTSVTDKESSSTEATTPDKQDSFEPSVADRVTSTDDKQEPVSTNVPSPMETSQTIETTEQQIATVPPPSISDKMSDTINSDQSEIQKEDERLPAESGLSEAAIEQLQQAPISSTEQTTEQQLTTDEETTIEKSTTLPTKNDTETETEQSTKLIESSGTGDETYLDAYRDQTGRLRRKKPRKHVRSSSSKQEDVLSTPQLPPSEESTLDPKIISDHWADVLATPISSVDDELKLTSESIEGDQQYEDEDLSKASSKLDSFLPEYIRQQIRSGSSPRSASFIEHRSKSSSVEPRTTSTIQSSITERILQQGSSNQSTSADTSENEGQKQIHRSFDDKSYSVGESQLISSLNLTESNTSLNSSSSSPSDSIRKKKQRPKMLKKDVEAKTLLTHEFDDSPLNITEIRQALPVTQLEDDENRHQSFLTSVRDQFDSAVSTISNTYSTALFLPKETAADEEQGAILSNEQVPSISDSSNIPSKPSSETTILTATTKKSSTRSPRKRSKRDSGPDYENLTLQSSIDSDHSASSVKGVSTSSDKDQPDLIRIESQKQHSRQRTSSGRHISNTEDDNEQQAVLADDEEEKQPVYRSRKSSTRTSENRTESESLLSSTHDIPDVTSTENLAVDEQPTTTTTNEQLRVVQGFHSYTPNKYQYNQYEEGSAVQNEQLKPSTVETESEDTILSRGFGRWLQQSNEIKTTSPSTSEKQESPILGSGLTRAMQSLIIQPVESDLDDDEEEDDSWNGPRAKKPTYTTGVRIEKRIHSASGYNINHPRSATLPPAWLMSSSNDNTYQDDQSKFDPDEEDDSLDDTSDKPATSKTIETQFSTQDERKAHLNNLADLSFQPVINSLSSSSSSPLSSSAAAKWNEPSIRSDDTNQQQTSFTDDDVQRCLGEDFYRESLAVNTLQNERRLINVLEDLVVKPTEVLEDIDDEENNSADDNNNSNTQQNRNNNNNNNRPTHFDEWAHFLERQTSPNMFLPSASASSQAMQDLSSTQESSYARVLDEDTLVSDKDRTSIMEHVQYSFESDQQRYGDFSPISEMSSVPPPPTIDHTISSTVEREQELLSQQKPSETFLRWRSQVSQQPDVLHSNSSNLTSTDATNDDEIFISHSDHGLSRRVSPST
ncbi:unnamed protein product, partial [Adineta ricciae]